MPSSARLSFPERAVRLVATAFGLGYSPFASGTVGSLLGIPLAVALTVFHGHLWWQLAIAAVLVALSIPVCDAAERSFGKKDDGRIVADEYMLFPIPFIAQFPAYAWLCEGGTRAWVAVVLIAYVFIVARVCDILKPTPARQIQALPGGWGVVLDDFIADVYSWIIVWGTWQYVERFAQGLFTR